MCFMITDEDQDAYGNGVVKILLEIRATANKALTFLPSGAPPPVFPTSNPYF